MQNAWKKHPSREEYLGLASQCDELTASATNEADRRDYARRAVLWRQLAEARLAQNIPEQHFAAAPFAGGGASPE